MELLLLGAGHAHVEVLRRLARTPVHGVRSSVIAREPDVLYTGMLPGVIRGDYPPSAARIPLGPLAAAAGARLIVAEAMGLDFGRRRVRLSDGAEHGFDLLSLDLGGSPSMPPGAEGMPVKPIGQFLATFEATLAARLRSDGRVAVIGGGAGGVELAIALCRRPGARAAVHLICDTLLPEAPPRARRLVATALADAGVRLHAGRRATGASAGAVRLADGGSVMAEAVIWATGAAAAPFLAASGLACDDAGCVRVDAALRSRSHPFVFAAGDCASLDPPRPKAGVWAVRAGPPLDANLRRAIAGRPLRPWRPQARALAILGLGGGRALAWRGGLFLHGRIAWLWKDRLDRRWVTRYLRVTRETG